MSKPKVSIRSLLAVVALVCASWTAPAFAADAMSLNDANAIFDRWIKAYEARDAAAIMDSFDATLVYSQLGEADQNFDELKANYLKTFKEPMPVAHWKVVPQEIHAQGDLAVVVSQWELREESTQGGNL